MQKGLLKLSRELRFAVLPGAEPMVANAANGFAGSPALGGLAPFVTLTLVISGGIDPRTGMLINIKLVDRLLRQIAVPALSSYYHADPSKPRGGADILPTLAALLRPHLAPHRLHSLALELSPYLRLTFQEEEPTMVHLSEKFEFSAAHRLHSDALSAEENVEVFGRCNNPSGHGHNYELEVTVSGEPDAKTGAVIAIQQLHQIVNRHVIDVFDHKHLNVDCVEFRELNPTVENIAQVIFGKLAAQFPSAESRAKLTRIRVWETPKTFAEISA